MDPQLPSLRLKHEQHEPLPLLNVWGLPGPPTSARAHLNGLVLVWQWISSENQEQIEGGHNSQIDLIGEYILLWPVVCLLAAVC